MKPLRIHYFQHVPFEGLGFIETWAKDNNHLLTATKFYEDETLPNVSDFDWLIVMGGPMGVYDVKEHPWLKTEIDFIAKAIQAGKTVVGICLGAQLIATALGAKVYANSAKEIGWFPVMKTRNGIHHSLLQNIPNKFISFHWHGDTFDLPTTAVHLLQTPICANQAFLYGDKVLGLQFHLEITPQMLAIMIENCKHKLVMGDYIQTEIEILQQAQYCTNANAYLADILTRLQGEKIL